MARKPRTKMDPFEREIELAFEPGTFIPDGRCFSFVRGLEQTAAKIDTMVGSEPTRAEVLYESFLAGCYQKADDLDDSSGGFGQFVAELYGGWVKARQANGADPDETVSRLLSRMDDDPYGFCYHLEKDVAGVLDRRHLAASVKQVRARLDGAAKTTAAGDGAVGNRLEYVRRRWGDALRTLYIAQKDVTSYMALTRATELTADDCHAIGSLLVARRKPDEALTWIDRGIELDEKTPYGSSVRHDLAKLKRELLVKLGRGNEAIEAVWAEYLAYPSTFTYGDLMKLAPRAERARWHEKAMEAQWEATVAQVRVDHRRKSGFMSGFENLIAGAAPREEPSFLQRAKARWNKHKGWSR